MAVILSKISNPWGRQGSGDLQRADLWQLDLAPAVRQMISTLQANGITRDWLAQLKLDSLVFQARSVVLPSRQISANQVKQDNATANVPGYNQGLGTITVTFVHDATDTGDDVYTSPLWLALELWRAVVRAGQGFSFTGQGGSLLDLSLVDAARPVGGGVSLIPDYAHDVKVTLLRGARADDLQQEADTDQIDYGLNLAAQYLVRQMWLADMQLGELTYDAGNRLLDIRTSFYAADYHTIT